MTLDRASMELMQLIQKHLLTLPADERRKFIRTFNTLAKQAEQRLRARHKKQYQETVVKPAKRLADKLDRLASEGG